MVYQLTYWFTTDLALSVDPCQEIKAAVIARADKSTLDNLADIG
jgi:hypothetical protein